jgi:hypothetical protein
VLWAGQSFRYGRRGGDFVSDFFNPAAGTIARLNPGLASPQQLCLANSSSAEPIS